MEEITMKKKLLLSMTVFFIFAASNSVLAMDNESTVGHQIGKGYFFIGSGTMKIDKLNTRLSGKGYPKFSDSFLTLGGGGHGVVNRFIIGGEGMAFMTEDREAVVSGKTYKNSLTGGCGFFDIGYSAYSHKGLSIYPILGIGGGGYSLNITDRSSPKFDEILDTPGRSSHLSSASFLLSLSLGADYMLNFEKRPERKGGLIFGLRVGYIFAPVTSNWNIDNIEVFGGPKTGIEGLFLHFMIGGGGSGPKMPRG
jgi:hypothetical protein